MYSCEEFGSGPLTFENKLRAELVGSLSGWLLGGLWARTDGTREREEAAQMPSGRSRGRAGRLLVCTFVYSSPALGSSFGAVTWLLHTELLNCCQRIV